MNRLLLDFFLKPEIICLHSGKWYCYAKLTIKLNISHFYSNDFKHWYQLLMILFAHS